MESYSDKLKTKKPLSLADKQYLEKRDLPQFTHLDFKPYGPLMSCAQAAQNGKSIHVDSFGRKYWIDKNPETGRFERIFCHEIGELKKIGKLKTAPGIALAPQNQAMQLNTTNKSNTINKSKSKKLKVIDPASTKASCGAAASVGRKIEIGPRGGKYYFRKAKKSGNMYKVYCKG